MRLRRRLAILAIGFMSVFVFMGAEDCSSGDTGGKIDQQRKEAVSQRAEIFDRAVAVVPPPKPVNFPLRRALAEFTKREDLLDHPWYVYILGDNGNTVGYYVSKHAPVNSCTFLSSTEQVWSGENGKSQVLTAPSLDGIYYGGSGASSGCDEWFFFDYASDAMIKIRGMHFYVADQPLRLEAAPITVKTTP